jgi:hypothetical protein
VLHGGSDKLGDRSAVVVLFLDKLKSEIHACCDLLGG